MQTKVNDILEEVRKVIVGKDEKISRVLMAILAGGHVLLEDVPGVGKTTLALAFSKTLGLDYNRVQFTPDVVASDIVGFSMYEKESGSFNFRKGAIFCNLFLADEINRTSSKTQSALLEVMEEGQVTADGQTYQLPKPFTVIATQNPAGSAGTQLLPNAQLDRFLIRLEMGYPDFASQVEILRDRQAGNPIDSLKEAVTAEELRQMQEWAGKIYASDEILEYITRLSAASREHQEVTLGISPRGSLAVLRMAKACAFVNGRDYVFPKDVQDIFLMFAVIEFFWARGQK